MTCLRCYRRVKPARLHCLGCGSCIPGHWHQGKQLIEEVRELPLVLAEQS
jgi:DNA-directed RNA polymerase subunit N (RpoN/RPB10)